MLWDIAWRHLWQHRVRSALIIVAVAVTLSPYLVITSTSSTEDMERELRVYAGKVFVQQPAAGDSVEFPSLSSTVPASVAAELLALDGVDRAVSSAVLFAPLARVMSTDPPVAALALGIEPGHEAAFLGNVEVAAGEAVLRDAHSVILGDGAAQYYTPVGGARIGPGQSIQIAGQDFTITGVLAPGLAVIDSAVLMPLATAQESLGRTSSVSAVILTATRVEDAGALAATIGVRFPDLHVTDQAEMLARAKTMLKSVALLFDVLNGAVVAAAIVIIAVVMIVSVMEQRRQIGALRALGAGRAAILSLVLGQSLTLTVAGVALAWPTGLFWYQVAISLVGPATTKTATSVWEFAPNWPQLALLALAIAALSAAWPAWQTTRIEPLDALR